MKSLRLRLKLYDLVLECKQPVYIEYLRPYVASNQTCVSDKIFILWTLIDSDK